ncbi:Calx-beta domain-containing protein [uncultured Legionella sp.]|uniref:Calx-beta domain-containing protein n=1 Tax=uncultured Legionella sp. TaxID=210934 RepID=UPI00262C8070|nr:Calx-beta domain-containing protein [uncultured Legionella sp.]
MITVTGTNDTPVTSAVILNEINEDSGRLITQAELLAHATDIDDNALLTVTHLISSGNGTLHDNGNGTWTYTPALNDDTDVSFSYTITDGYTNIVGTASLVVNAVADVPTLNIGSITPPDTGFIKYTWNNSSNANSLNITANGNGENPNTLQSKIDSTTVVPTSQSLVTNVESTGNTSVAVGTASLQTGFIYLEAGTAYKFSGYGDDSIKITVGTTFSVGTTWGAGNSGQFSSTFTPTTTGFYEIKIYHSNSDGPGNYDVNLNDINLSTANYELYQKVTDITAGGIQLGPLDPGGFYAGFNLNHGNEDTPIALSKITAALVDTDGSETLHIAISGIPSGAVLSDGTHTFIASAGNTIADVSGWNLNTLIITPPQDFNGTFSLQVTVTATESSNGNSASNFGVISVEVYPVNDAAVISGTASGSVTEAGGVDNATAGTSSVSGILTVTDVDGGQAGFQNPANLAGAYGTFTFNAGTGAWTYTLDNTRVATQALKAGDVMHDTLTVASIDGTQKVIDVTVNGSNDVAVIGSPTVSTVTEDVGVNGSGNLVATGSISISDVDTGQSAFNTTVANVGTPLGTLVLAANGSYTYSVSNAATQSLGAGQTATDSFAVTSVDGTSKVVTFTISGVNDAAVIGTPSVSSVTEDVGVNGSGNLVASGSISISDADAGQALFNTTVTNVGTPLGTLVLAANGSYTYSVSNAATQSLGAGQTATDSFTVRSVDGTSKVVTFTINGMNDAAVIGTPSVSSVTEDVGVNGSGNLVASGSISISDADAGQALFSTTVTNVGTPLGALVLAANGSYTYTVSNAATQNLSVGQIKTDSFIINSMDGTSKTITFTINGTNDVPVAVNDSLYAQQGTSITYSANQLLANDTDIDSSNLTIASVTSGVGGTAVLNANGTVTFTPNSSFNGNANFTYTVSDGTGISNAATVNVNVVGVAAISSPSASEGNALVYTVNLSSASNVSTTFAYSIGGGTASSGDYSAPTFSNGVTLSNGVLTIPAGVSSFTVNVPALSDLLVESNETVPLTIGNTTGVGTIVDNTIASTLSINDVIVNEAAGTATFTVTLSSPSLQTVTVSYNTSSGTATANSDFSSVNGTLTFPPGVTTQTIIVPIVNDITYEGNETFNVNLSNAANATIANGIGTGTIVDNDAPPEVSSISNASVSEGSNLIFTVNLVTAAALPATYPFSLGGGTATAGSDYSTTPVFSNGVTLSNGVLTVPAGVTSFTVTIPTIDDALREDSETVSLTVGTRTATGTINDNDPVPQVTINDVSVNEAAGTATFTVSLSSASGQTVTVGYNTNGGTATAGTDYTVVNGTLTFAPGVTTQIITVPITNDALYESNETFNVNLTSANNASISKSVGQGTIVNDDAMPGLSINNVNVNEDAGTATFTVTLSAASGLPVTVSYNTSNGSAMSGSDYSATNGNLTFAPGELTKTIIIQITNDITYEGNETFNVNLSNAANATIANGIGTGTIVDNDAPPEVSSISNASVSEGSNLIFTVNLVTAAALPATYPFSLGGGTATAGSDYSTTPVFSNGVTLSNGVLTVPAGVTSFTVTIPTIDDALREDSETVSLTVGTRTATGTINDNDPVPQVTINDVSVNEAAGTATFTVSLSSASGQTVTVGYNTNGGTATAGTDYTVVNGTLTFAPGVTTQIITVPITNDALYESNETFNVNLTSANNASISKSVGQGTIVNDDAMPGLSINNVNVNEDAGTATFTVTLSAASGLPVTVSYNTSNGSAMSGSDYSATNGNLTFAPGELTKTITVQITNDSVFEGNESFNVNLSNATNATITTSVGVGTILANDFPIITLNADVVSVNEDNVSTGNVLSNDSSTLSLTVTSFSVAGVSGTFNAGSLATIPNVGTLTLGANGGYTFTPITNYNGSVPQITYNVTDGNSTASSSLKITVNPVNDAPVAVNDTIHLSPSITLSGLSAEFYNYNESSSGGNLTNLTQVEAYINVNNPNATFTSTVLNYAQSTGDLGGTGKLASWISGNSSNLVFYNQQSTGDAIVKFEGNVTLAAGTYNFRVTADDGYTIRIDGVVVAQVNANQSPATTTHASFNITTGGSHDIEIIYWDQGGDFVFKPEIRMGSGAYSYLGQSAFPTNYQSGVEGGSYVYQVSVADLLANDTDIDTARANLQITGVSNPSDGGTVTLSNGIITFTAPPNFDGQATFTYTLSDGAGGISSAVVTVVDDRPLVDVQNGMLSNASGNSVVGTLVDFGADSVGSSIILNGTPPANLSSGGVPVTYVYSGNTIIGMAGTNTVFTLIADAQGNYKFDLIRPLDPLAINYTPSGITGSTSNAAAYYVNAATGSISTAAGTDWAMQITASSGNVSRTNSGLGVQSGSSTNIDFNEKLIFNFDNEMSSRFADPGLSANITLARVGSGTYNYTLEVKYTDGSTSTVSGTSSSASQLVTIAPDPSGKVISEIVLTNPNTSINLRVSALDFKVLADTTEFTPTITNLLPINSSQYYVNATTGGISSTAGSDWAMKITGTSSSGTSTNVHANSVGLGVGASGDGLLSAGNIGASEKIKFDFDNSGASGSLQLGNSLALTLARQSGAAYRYDWIVMFTDGSSITGTSGLLNTADSQTLVIRPSGENKAIDYVEVTNSSGANETGAFRITSLNFDVHNNTDLQFTFNATDGDGDQISGNLNVTVASSDIMGTSLSETLHGDSHDNVIYGGAGDDLIYGGDGNDTIYGGDGNDFIYGDAGDDLIFGQIGDDYLFGGDGNDILHGGLGNDVIDGGQGNDVMTGGGGQDIFVFDKADIGSIPAIDTITDFKLNLNGDASADKSILDLTDLFKDSTLSGDSLDSLLQISTVHNETTNQIDTVIKTDPTGSGQFNTSPETIVLSGVDVASAYGTSDSGQLLTQMLAANVIVMGH